MLPILRRSALARSARDFFLVMCTAFIALAAFGEGATVTVGPGESIQAAIDGADPGDVIQVMSGTYDDDINLSKRLSLTGIDAGKGAPIIRSATLIADGCELAGFKVESQHFGIDVFSDNNNISGNDLECCFGGICLKDCRGNSISNNNIKIRCRGWAGRLLRGDGIHLMNSDNNSIKNNIAEGGLVGIYMDASSHNLVEDNRVSDNTFGIGLLTAVGNTIKNNVVLDSSDNGLGILKFSNDCIVEGNTVQNSGGYGIYLKDSSNGVIYRNSFLDNGENACSEDVRSSGSSSQWHSPQPVSISASSEGVESFLGNYWSDYRGRDSGGDGIGDVPHRFDGGQDDYPLMNPK